MAYKQEYISCSNPPFHQVKVLDLIDDAINLQQPMEKENNYHHQNEDLKNFTKLIVNQPIRNFTTNANNDEETIHIKGIEIKDEAFSLTISDDTKEKQVEQENNITELRSKSEETIERQLKENYKIEEEEELEKKYKAALKAKDETIESYKEEIKGYREIIQSLSKEPIVIKQESEKNQ